MKKFFKECLPQFLVKWYQNNQKAKILKKYGGNKVFCPICNSSFNEFGVYGLLSRKNAKCHICGSLERHRLLWLYFKKKTELLNQDEKIKLLHFAPERTFYDIFSTKENIEYIPCDLFPESYSYLGKIKKVDITNIPFGDNSFDVILCIHVLEHVLDDTSALLELYRVMKKQAWAIIQVPIDYTREKTFEDFTIISPEEREKAFGQHDHVRWYGSDFKERLAKAGFIVTEDHFVNSYSLEDRIRYGIMENELIYFCKKS